MKKLITIIIVLLSQSKTYTMFTNFYPTLRASIMSTRSVKPTTIKPTLQSSLHVFNRYFKENENLNLGTAQKHFVDITNSLQQDPLYQKHPDLLKRHLEDYHNLGNQFQKKGIQKALEAQRENDIAFHKLELRLAQEDIKKYQLQAERQKIAALFWKKHYKKTTEFFNEIQKSIGNAFGY